MTTDSRAALSNGTKIWRDSLNAYSAKKKGSKSSAKPATRPRRKPSAKAVHLTEVEPLHYVQRHLKPWVITTLSATLNKTKDISMKLDKSERYLIPSMQGPRPISLYSLRPGDWLYAAPATGKKGYDLMVVQNSNVLKRIELLWPSGNMEVAEYEHIILTGEGMHYLGHGHKRLWRNRLPRFIRRFFNVYSKPQSK